MRLKSILVAAAVGGMTTAPANAVDFHYLDYNGGLYFNSAAEKSYKVAIAYWNSVLGDNVTVNLLIGAASFDNPNQQTAADGQWDGTSIATTEWVYKALAADSKSSLDAQAVANLSPLSDSREYPGITGVTVLANDFNEAGGYADETVRIDNDGSANNLVTLVNRANAKAMNLEFASGIILDETVADVSIFYSVDTIFDYDPTDGIDAGAYDFTGMAIRDIGIGLGLKSQLGWYDRSTGPDKNSEWALENNVTAKTIDLFRYSSAGLDWSTSESDKYFSLDGGASELFGNASYHTGVYNGTGAEPSYWRDDETGEALGIMDADPGTGRLMSVSALDLAALDAIGWDLTLDVLANSAYRMSTADIYRAMTAVPEPSTWLQMILGFGMMGRAVRYRRATAPRVAFSS